jgi:hypothetical protein
MLDSLPAVIVDFATFGLAALGGYVAIKPPKEAEIGLRRLYVGSFVALALLGISANVWERHIDETRRTQAETDLKAAQNKFSSDLINVQQNVQRTSDAILSFVTNPPKGIPVDQAVAFARALTSNRGVSGKLESVPNARVGDMARAIVNSLNEMAQYWRADDQNEYMSTTDKSCYGVPYTPQGCKDAQALWVSKKKELTARWQEKVKDLIRQANECRVEIFRRLLPMQTNVAQDEAAKKLYEKMVADSRNISPEALNAVALYLDNLWKQLP